MISRRELSTRLEQSMTIHLSEATQEAHWAAIEGALADLDREGAAAPSRLRRRALVLAFGVMMTFGTASLGLAAEGSLPGETLYPVKQVTETVRSWFDDDVIADHRLDELEITVERKAGDSVIADRLRDARNAVGDLPPDHQYRTRLAELEGGVGEPPGENPTGAPTAPPPNAPTTGPGNAPGTAPGRDQGGNGEPGEPTPSPGTQTTARRGDGGSTGSHQGGDG